ncbi:HNH endonuclease [Sphingobacterium faecium]|uniref:HNH endonuclease n=1 Tax=Sphingobacterium faecium TaxID=34087 RepID=UPI003DA48C70
MDGTPVAGKAWSSGERLEKGDYLGAAGDFSTALAEGFTMGFSSKMASASANLFTKWFGNNVAKGVGTGAQYSVAFETKLASNLYPGKGYYTHFKAANTSLSNAIASDAAFANSMSKLGISIPRSSTGNILGKSPVNWVWHHDVGAGVMQLVPKTQHTTGSMFWNTLHPGGVGGMSIWGR